MDNTNSTGKKLGIIAVVVIILAIIAFLLWKTQNSPSAASVSAPDQNTGTPVSNSTSTPVAVNDRKYKDGTYTATGNYTSPAGQEEVEINLTLNGDVVTAATFTGKATNPTSRLMQSRFNAGFAAYVIGKPIDQINLTVVNGSSLAPKGFMDALAKIKAEAAVTA